MPRAPRQDSPGLDHHVLNRGIARRTVFETRRDVRMFLALLAREVRAGRIRLIAWSILTTHFHLLVQSVTGEISSVMQRVMNRYVRYFNRSRRRDGPLYRARFWSRPVTSNRYRTMLIRYIDQNAPQARLSSAASAYPYGSAYHYVRARRPRWMDPSWVDRRLGAGGAAERGRRYAALFGAPLRPSEQELVESRIARSRMDDVDELDSLLDVAPQAVRAWMDRKARLADGTRPGQPYVAAALIDEAVDAARRTVGPWRSSPKRGFGADLWPVVRVGLLRLLGGVGLAEVDRRYRWAPGTARRRAAVFTRLYGVEPLLAPRVTRVALCCLAEQGAAAGAAS